MKMEQTFYNSLTCPIWIKNQNQQVIFTNKKFQILFKLREKSEEEITSLFKKLATLDALPILEIDSKMYLNQCISEDKQVYLLVDLEGTKTKSEFNQDKSILKTVIDNIPELIFYKDKDLNYLGMNKACESFYHERGVHDIIGKNDLDLPLDKEFIKACYSHDKQVLEEKKTMYIEEDAPIDGSDERAYFQTIKTPIINNEGEVDGIVGIVLDITEQKNIERKLRDISYTDKMTSLYNRAFFDVKLNELMEKNQFPIGIINGDVNGLKLVNDTIGHLEGDKLLKSIAEILKRANEADGFVFRWGGDEFVTIIPQASDEICRTYIEKVKEICLQSENEFFQCSIAQGYALLKENDKVDEILRESEDKVYREKLLQTKSVRTSIISTLNKNLQLKNIETEEHTDRVVSYCKKLGETLNLDQETLNQLLLVGKLHDIGKSGIPDEILLKPGKLTSDEYEIMKTHSEKGYRFALLIPELSHVARGILSHHEKWDGTGYPFGISGKEIPLTSRIVSIVDAYDAMTNNRIYSKARSKEEAIQELLNCAGTHFDPDIVHAFCKILEQEYLE